MDHQEAFSWTSGPRIELEKSRTAPVIPSAARSDFRTPVESIGLQKPENLLLLFFTAKADSSSLRSPE